MIIPDTLEGGAAFQPGKHHAGRRPDALDVPLVRRCGWCGATDTEASMRVATWDTDSKGPLVRCADLKECTRRYLAQAGDMLAQAEAEAAQCAQDATEATALPSVPEDGSKDGESAGDAPKPAPRRTRNTKPRPKSTRAHDLLVKAADRSGTAPEDSAGDPGLPLSGSPAGQDRGGDAT